jgi:hypothetical protein
MICSIGFMKHLPGRNTFLIFAVAALCGAMARAQNLDAIGVTLLRTETTNLNGAGVRVAQPEAYDPGTTNWEVNPDTVGQPVSLFKYFSSDGTSTSYPNTLSGASGHAGGVGNEFYGILGGVATNVMHVDNYEANYFYNNIVGSMANINDPVINQSFTFGPQTIWMQQQIDTAYDNYSVANKTLFISAANNYGTTAPNSTNVCAPGTSYNCISVGAYQNGSSANSLGPTIDNGRCKPDITAPSGETSFSTPQVAGAAAVLMQAGLRSDGGSDTNSAADIRTVKALLLNGAVKPSDWTNTAPSPLDFHYGAGVLNVFNSYKQLTGGKHGYIVSTSVATNSPHLPTGATGTVGVLSGWDFNTNTSTATTDGVKHYYFNVTNGLNNARFTATTTLVWNRQQNQTGINNLDLFLYDALSSNLVACSTSLVDNVEHLWLPQLPQSRYDLQVVKNGGTTVSTNETYALAFEFFSQSLNIAESATNVTLAWPVYPAGFLVESTTDLTPPAAWTTNNLPVPVIANGSNYMLLNATTVNQFFRLRRPNF